MLSLLLLASSSATCPWLTQGSASRLLGDPISVKVYVSHTGAGSCTFFRPHDTLEIRVSKAALASCPGGSTALKGIGNQAARCQSGGAEMISGRVRDLHFTVTRTARGQKQHDDALEQIAEQIAGNLY